MLAILVIGFSGTQISGAAGTAAGPSADSRAQGTDARVSAPDNCPGVRRALRWYVGRTNDHRAKMGAPAYRLPAALTRCPRYQLHVWVGKARAARVAYARWQRTTGVVVNRLNRVLASTPLAGTGRDLEEIARHYRVSPYFIVAVAATESSIGRAACSSNRRNIWGLSSCGSGWYVPQFASWRSAYEFFAAFVNRQWPGHSTPYSFRGYAACSDCWGRKVSEWMHDLFGVPAVTRYP